jgi:hypothetical protein
MALRIVERKVGNGLSAASLVFGRVPQQSLTIPTACGKPEIFPTFTKSGAFDTRADRQHSPIIQLLTSIFPQPSATGRKSEMPNEMTLRLNLANYLKSH